MITPISQELVRGILPRREKDAHKGTFGHVFIVAGSRRYVGAAKLVCGGALRSGVGLVTLGTEQGLWAAYAASLTEVMHFPLAAAAGGGLAGGAAGTALDFARDMQACVIGPGLGQGDETRAFIREFVAGCGAGCVVDADGLNALGAHPPGLAGAKGPRIITPHPGEMARLAATTVLHVQADRVNTAQRFADRHGCVTVLKGHRSVVAAPGGDAFENPTGNPGMATGGTGDVLAGLIGGLLAQGTSPLEAALAGVYVHGLAGDLVARERGERGLIATDLVDALPRAWREIEGSAA